MIYINQFFTYAPTSGTIPSIVDAKSYMPLGTSCITAPNCGRTSMDIKVFGELVINSKMSMQRFLLRMNCPKLIHRYIMYSLYVAPYRISLMVC